MRASTRAVMNDCYALATAFEPLASRPTATGRPETVHVRCRSDRFAQSPRERVRTASLVTRKAGYVVIRQPPHWGTDSASVGQATMTSTSEKHRMSMGRSELTFQCKVVQARTGISAISRPTTCSTGYSSPTSCPTRSKPCARTRLESSAPPSKTAAGRHLPHACAPSVRF